MIAAMTLRLENISNPQIHSVNLTLGPMSCISLSGPSGIGKSQLLKTIAELNLYEGKLFLNGQFSKSMPAHMWRRQVAYLPTESQWWLETVGTHFKNPISEVLNQLGFDQDIMQRSVKQLSSGEKQRLALMRVLENQPKVLLLDEPTANLDAENIDRLIKVIQDYQRQQQAILIWVSHHLNLIKQIADQHYTIQNKQLVSL